MRPGKLRAARFKFPVRRTKSRQTGTAAVKGTNRQVVVVQSPDPEIFTEAIFVLRDDWSRNNSAEQVIEEARRAAGAYLGGGRTTRRYTRRVRGVIWAAAAAVTAGLAWLTLRLIGVM